MINHVTVIGAGAWGTTIANLLVKKGIPVLLWVHTPQTEALMKNQKSPYLPGVALSKDLRTTISLDSALSFSPDWVVAVPSRFLSEMIGSMKPFMKEKTHLLSLVKGMILQKEPLWLSDYFQTAFPSLLPEHFSILSGPNFALEIAQDLMAATVVASLSEEEATDWQQTLATPNFRVYTNTDILGVQLGGVMKNIIALAAGILDGKQLGSNLKSALIVRGIHEMKRLAALVGADPNTLAGLSGLGDLIGTCTSSLSRNLWAGTLIGQGKSLEFITKTHKTVEGIDALPAVLAIAKDKIEMPISEALYAILFQNKPVTDALHDLMSRTVKPEKK
ncbi:NAD(P)-dependent glycerol-3-phosphate dehydrogenase [bacterium]|nr:NAD(P)-dependent glycerol-3-phosphate dehydrogenase [bacterium]